MKGFCLEVSGPFACFTRPEMKVERVSYDVITPSAARAIFDSILWKPAIFWNIRRIDVLAPIKWMSVRRNEVAAVASPRKACIYVEDNRQQRAGLFLRDVRYRLYGDFDFIPPDKRMKSVNSLPEGMLSAEDATDIKKDESPAKYAAMFERRARKGQCFNQPYLGCREFSADFRLVNPETEPAEPVQESRDLGWMLYDMDFSDPTDPRPLFFNARMENGVIRVPSRDNKEEVRG
ncbi:MAG TPA: type I-C CRISPR-associated protein Cas5c [Elusimicrobiales bacterium]|nr:type I-C CRISPR-associated protein Cas5c [Elusimicrobiales bacterium]